MVNNYPSGDDLRRIRDWPWPQRENAPDPPDWKGLLDFMESIWPEYGRIRKWPADGGGIVYEFITEGWSGCEDVIHSFYDNFIAVEVLWESSHRNGTHVLVLHSHTDCSICEAQGLSVQRCTCGDLPSAVNPDGPQNIGPVCPIHPAGFGAVKEDER